MELTHKASNEPWELVLQATNLLCLLNHKLSLKRTKKVKIGLKTIEQVKKTANHIHLII